MEVFQNQSYNELQTNIHQLSIVNYSLLEESEKE